MTTGKRARAIAFYLPQYHPVEVNDNYWGKGFTEWTNVTKAKPLFRGHRQPDLPSDLGFYDLRLPEIRCQQAELARNSGIEAFCYWHYWFGEGKRVLERIFNEVVDSGTPNFPFCLGWANETWSGRWHGFDDQILLKQEYPGEEDYIAHFNCLKRAFSDSRYFKVNGRNVFLIYRPDEIPDLEKFAACWQQLAVSNSLPAFYFIAVSDQGEELPGCIDGWILSGLTKGIKRQSALKNIFMGCAPELKLYEYSNIVNNRSARSLTKREIPLVVPNWDNTPRSGVKGRVFLNATPALYKTWLLDAVKKVEYKPFDERIIFIKSWNEWAEGNYLEPGRKHGSGFLDATRAALLE